MLRHIVLLGENVMGIIDANVFLTLCWLSFNLGNILHEFFSPP